MLELLILAIIALVLSLVASFFTVLVLTVLFVDETMSAKQMLKDLFSR